MLSQLISHLQYYLLRQSFKAHSEVQSTVNKEPDRALTNGLVGKGAGRFRF